MSPTAVGQKTHLEGAQVSAPSPYIYTEMEEEHTYRYVDRLAYVSLHCPYKRTHIHTGRLIDLHMLVDTVHTSE